MELVKIIGDKLATPVTVLSGIVHKGAYDAGTDYAVGDVVSYNGASYVMYTDAGAGTAPTDTTKWQVLSSPQQYVESIGELALTNATTDNTISIDQNGNVGTDVATDGAVHIENTGNTGIGLGVYTNIGAAADAPLVYIKSDATTFDQPVVKIENDGSSYALNIVSTLGGAEAVNITTGSTSGSSVRIDAAAQTTGAALLVTTDNASFSGSNLVLIRSDNSGSTGTTLKIQQDGSGNGMLLDINGAGAAISIDHDDTGTGASIVIDRDGNNVAYIFGVAITVDNAGVGGLVCAIDFSSMADTEPLFKLTSTDTDLSTKSPETDAEAGWFPVLVGTTKYAVPIYALS